MPEQIANQVTEQLVRDYRRDGVTCIHQAVGSEDIDVLRREVAHELAEKKSNYVNHSARNGSTDGAFKSAFKIWENNATLADFVRTSNLPAFAARLMGSEKINLLFDQCFVKQPGTNDPTPWHNDQPFWPIKGDQVITLWIALDKVTRQSSAVQFVRASHRWDRWFQPKNFSGDNEFSINPKFENDLNIEANRDDYDIISWDLAPGDVLAFHGMILHGAQANKTRDMLRRGYAIRYTGDDVVYDPHLGSTPALLKDDLVEGGALDGPYYPVVGQF